MEYAINLLEKERELVIVSLKNGEKERLTDLKQLDKALGWLRLLKEQQIGMVKKYQLERMPPIDGRGVFSSYRIVIDNETDDIKFWEEYKKDDGSSVWLYSGDYILREKY